MKNHSHPSGPTLLPGGTSEPMAIRLAAKIVVMMASIVGVIVMTSVVMSPKDLIKPGVSSL